LLRDLINVFGFCYMIRVPSLSAQIHLLAPFGGDLMLSLFHLNVSYLYKKLVFQKYIRVSNKINVMKEIRLNVKSLTKKWSEG